MTEELTFLPWLRRGLAQALAAPGPVKGPIARGPAVTAWVDVLETRATRELRLHGPDRVAGLTPGQVLRCDPRPDSVEVETTLFPSVELATPDLPWMFTPAAHDDRGRLRPWLVLVVVREQEGVRLETPGGSLPLLHIDAPAVVADELPDLADAHGWAHVQSLAGLDGVAAAVAGGTGEVTARLLCPRRLLPDSSWLACVVPAFDGGVLAGRGEAVPAGAEWGPAWEQGQGLTHGPLPVYHSWRFSTGRGGDFETLCRRLQADDSGVAFGLQALDVSDPGLMEAAEATVLLDYEGALQTVGVVPRAWDARHRADFQPAVAALLERAAVRADHEPVRAGAPYDPLTEDPVVGPPLYGQWPAGVSDVSAKGWARELNLHPSRRAAAGLGARAVQAAQEELVAGAWDQAGSVRATVGALNQARLAVEAGRRLTGRLAALGDGDLLHLTAQLHPLLGPGPLSVRARLEAGAVPAGLVSAAHLRLTRPGTPLARDWHRLADADGRLGAEHVATTVTATAQSAPAALTFAAYGHLAGAQISDQTVDERAPGLPDLPGLPPFVSSARLPRPSAAPHGGGPRPAERLEVGGGVVGTPEIELPGGLPVPTSGTDLVDIAADVLEGLDPLAAVRSSLVARVPALIGLLPADTLPTTVAVAPSFDDGLADDLIGLGAAFLLPGAGELGHNRVRLVESNPEFVAAFLIGANHELARELLWRGYPVDLRASFFQRFWDYTEPDRHDIEPLAGWTLGDSIAENLTAATLQPLTVFVVRGDVVRRYPTAHYFLQRARLDTDGKLAPVPGEVAAAVVRGALDPHTLFVGFDQARTAVVGDRPGGGDPGWLLAIEEQPAAPRFGLDDPPDPPRFATAPTFLDDLSWASMAADAPTLEQLTHAPLAVPWLKATSIEETTWGFNAAHTARACRQQPFRIYFPGDQLD